jgi:hypothetical protein
MPKCIDCIPDRIGFLTNEFTIYGGKYNILCQNTTIFYYLISLYTNLEKMVLVYFTAIIIAAVPLTL